MKRWLMVLILSVGLPAANAQPTSEPERPGMFLMTIFLGHGETKTLPEINEHLRQTGWYRNFPRTGVELCPGT